MTEASKADDGSFCQPYALKGQKLPAQGIALGIASGRNAPCKGKSFINHQESESFCPYRATGWQPC